MVSPTAADFYVLFLLRCTHLLLPVRQSTIAMCPCMASFIRLWKSFPGMWIKLR